VKWLKILFVTCLLAIASTILIISLDLLMGVQISGIFWKAINPFRVMEPAEYIIILLCIMVYFVDTFGAYLKKKKEKENPSN
jgi:CDP-diglyceride synthetase